MTTRRVIWSFVPLLVVAVLSFGSPTAQAQEETSPGTIGVEVGDWANYDSSAFSYESNITGYEEPPIELKVLTSVEWFIGEVLEVSGNNVTMQWGSYYDDGTKEFETQAGDPIAGLGNLPDTLAPAGLSPRDQFTIWLEEWDFPIKCIETNT